MASASSGRGVPFTSTGIVEGKIVVAGKGGRGAVDIERLVGTLE